MVILGILALSILFSSLYVMEVFENIKLKAENKTLKYSNKDLLEDNKELMQQLTSKVSLSELREELIKAYSLNRDYETILKVRKDAEIFIDENFNL